MNPTAALTLNLPWKPVSPPGSHHSKELTAGPASSLVQMKLKAKDVKWFASLIQFITVKLGGKCRSSDLWPRGLATEKIFWNSGL